MAVRFIDAVTIAMYAGFLNTLNEYGGNEWAAKWQKSKNASCRNY